MKFFNIDCHVSIISDVKNIFESLGHSVSHWSLSGHRKYFGFPPCSSPAINQGNWKLLDEGMVDLFYKTHKRDLDHYDAFVCGYPPAFLKLFEKFNKPIVVIAATRYDFPFLQDPYRLSWLEDSLNNNDNLILVANNAFDKAYCERFLKKEWSHIPSLCDYANAKHNQTRNETLVYSKFFFAPNGSVHESELPNRDWETLSRFKNIAHLPYNVSTMSIFEQNSMGIPLLFPTLEASLSMLANGWPIFSEIVFPNDLPERQAANFLNRKWLSLCDFYNGSIASHLFDFDFLKISDAIECKFTKDLIVEKWLNVISNI